MKSSCFVVVLLLAIATASRLSAAAAGESSGIPAAVGREVRAFIAKAGDVLGSATGWRSTANAGAAAAEAKNLRAVATRRKRSRKSGGASCVTAAMCRKKRVICGKRCYGAGSRSGLNHVPSRCVVKCKKCVPTC
ncbi:hypothetical protein ACP4OV_004549 [Aristida adscensionis]